MQSYNLTPGPHTTTVAVIGGNADLWAPLSQDLPLTIVAGRASRLTPTFNRKGQVAMSFNVEGLVGDFYVDEQLVAAQVPAVSLFVAPGNHAVAGRNLVDPAANGVYRYLDVSSPATVAANQTRAVVLRPQKEYLLGFGEVACRINGVEAGHDVRCNVAVDGQPLGTVEVGQTQSYNLAPGPHDRDGSGHRGECRPVGSPFPGSPAHDRGGTREPPHAYVQPPGHSGDHVERSQRGGGYLPRWCGDCRSGQYGSVGRGTRRAAYGGSAQSAQCDGAGCLRV